VEVSSTILDLGTKMEMSEIILWEVSKGSTRYTMMQEQELKILVQ
jgi:hypothetical protein